LADCGGNDCDPCGGSCTKIVDGGDLDVLLVPIVYSSSTDSSVLNNLNDWEARAALEASKLTTTPPFDGGQVSVWRLDSFNFDQNFQDKLANNDIGIFDNLNMELFKEREYSTLCPSIDSISFLPSTYERSFSGNLGSFNVVYRDDPSFNVITHETGHSFCGLSDEYEEDIGFLMDLRNSIYEGGSINCDQSPQLWIVYDDQGKPEHDDQGGLVYETKCKWWREFPDAGCIPGCMYSDSWYRPKNDFEDSMMNSNSQIGPADFGKGTWNQVSYKRCKDLVENYGT
jgi:hypothetical protein